MEVPAVALIRQRHTRFEMRSGLSHWTTAAFRSRENTNHYTKVSGCSDFVRLVISSSRIHSVIAVYPLRINGLSRAPISG